MLKRAMKDHNKKQGKDLTPKGKTDGYPIKKLIDPPNDSVGKISI